MVFGNDIGWAGAYVPLVVGETSLMELRNLAGPPQHPGQSWIMVNLKDGEFKWYTSGNRRSSGGRRSGRKSRRR